MNWVLTYMKTRLLLQLLIVPGLMITAAVAQPDPPGRVARLNLTNGAVSMLTQSTGPDWIPAQVNYPLTTGDQIWTDFGARAELHVGSAAIRLREETSATFSMLDDQVIQIQLIAGGLNLRVSHLYDREVFEIDTPNLAFTIHKPGDYRIDVNGQQTRVTLWSGAGEISGDNRTLPLRAHDYAVVSGYGQLSYNLMTAPAPDDFDRWAQDRDRRAQQSQSVRYVSPDMIGSEDLDLYGTWRETPDFGMVWAPRVNVGWAPYKQGHWAWVEPWGWTWIDDSPWGFAPFHYGRWAYSGGDWIWIPGPRERRVVYSPALVAWCGGGGGGGFRVSASIGLGLAWFALGPGEVYVPSHRASVGYVQRVNVTNTVVNNTVVTNVYNTTIVNRNTTNNLTYVNQNAPGAVVGMSHSDMAAGRRGAATVAPGTVQATQVSSVAPIPVTRPMMQPMPRGGNAAPVARPPEAVAAPGRPVVTRNQIPAGSQRPVFAAPNGGAAPSVSTAAPAQPPMNLPDPNVRRQPGRESDTIRPTRPAVDRPQVQVPVTEIPERVRRVPQAETAPPPARQERPVEAPPERVRRLPQVETPNTTPPIRPAERPVERTVERPVERQVQRPAERPVERIERPQPRPDRVERPINIPPPQASNPEARQVRPAEARPEPRPEPRREDRRPEPKREEKKAEEKKQQ